MASSVAGYKRALGSDTVPCDYADQEQADLIVLVGSNTAWCHPVLYQRIKKAKRERPDLQVVVIDPRRTATCEIADLRLALEPGSDSLLFSGLLDYLRREDALDWGFLERYVEGFSEAFAQARADAASIPVVAGGCRLSESGLAEFYRSFAATGRVVTLYSQGVNQWSFGTDKANAIVNCHLAAGRIGRPGMGPCSITGQPNAMGGREVGGLANQLAAHMDLEPEDVERIGRFWQADTDLPRSSWLNGLFAVDALDAPSRTSLLAGRPPKGQKDSGETICACFNVGLNTIIEAIQQDGLVSVDAIGAALQAGTNCGSCLPELERILHQERSSRAA